MLSSSSAAPFRPADPATHRAIAAQQQSFRMREFDFFVVIDFEATCEKDCRIYPQEIIEFPAVLVDAATGGLLSSFRTYVRPRHHPVLTPFCSELTGIKQDQVDNGVDLATALALHDKWLAVAGVAKNRLAIVTWGDWDCKTMLDFECKFKDIPKPSYFNQWVNLRTPFETAFGVGRRNLQEAVREAGLQWDGRLHCGLDDARNTAHLLVQLMRRGVRISITGSLAPLPLPKPEPELQPEPKPQSELQPQPLLSPVIRNLSWCADGPTTADSCCCYCGVPVRGDVVTTPGPMHGRFFYSCGNWTPTCRFFVWAA
jgi:ERI1 exoribonuclease 2